MSINEFGQRSFITWTAEDLRKEKEAEIQMRNYRGLTKEGKEVRGWLFMLDGHAYIIPLSDNFHTPSSFVYSFIEVIPETLGQSTGLKDKNGKELDWWEGDIFARSSDGKIEGVIIKDLGCFWLDRVRGGRTLLYECVDWSMCKVGNIHQKPEILEQDK